jgi:hypothetical protein
MTMWWGTNLALVAAAVLTLAVLWWPKFDTGRVRPLAMQILLVTVFVRFAVPILVIGSNLVFDTFLAAEQAAATQALEATRTEIEQLNNEVATPETPTEDQSVMEWLGTMLDNSLESMNVGNRLNSLRDRVSNAVEHIINLIVIFVLQTIILPLVFVWLFVELLKMLAARTTFRR